MYKKTVCKVAALLVTVAMVATLFAGCGNKPAASNTQNEQVTIQFWTISLQPTFTDFFNGLIKQYESTHKNVKIQWSDLPYDSIQNKLVAAIAGGTAPDVVNLNTELALTLANKGSLVDLNKEATDAQKSIYIQTLYNSVKINNSVYAFPWYGAPNIMIYNKSLFQKAGITQLPTTFDEMLADAKTMKEKTGASICVPDSFANMLYLEGIPYLTSDFKQAAFNTQAAVDLLTKYKQAADAGYITKSAQDWGAWDKMLQLYSTSKLAMINSGAQSIKRIKDEAPDVYKVTDVTTPLVGKAGTILNPLMNLVVPEKSKHHKEAIDFANFITNDENQLAFCKTVQIFPSTTKAAADPYFKSDTSTIEKKSIAIVADELPKTSDLSIGVAKQQDIFTELNNAAQKVMQGNVDPKTALDTAAANVNKLLAGN